MTKPAPKYTVLYWSGGSERGQWNQVLEHTEEQAKACAAELRRGGRVAKVYEAAQLERLGWPEGAPSVQELDAVLRLSGDSHDDNPQGGWPAEAR